MYNGYCRESATSLIKKVVLVYISGVGGRLEVGACVIAHITNIQLLLKVKPTHLINHAFTTTIFALNNFLLLYSRTLHRIYTEAGRVKSV